MAIQYADIDGQYVMEGDILLSKDQVYDSMDDLILESGEKRGAKRSVGKRRGKWPNNTVYYTINRRLSNQYRVTNAIKHWESKTNLKFVKGRGRGNYLEFYPGDGCSSWVGMTGGRQVVSLGRGCDTGAAIHEIGHAIGLYHEQTRNDRDKYITIHWNNMQSGMGYNFQKHRSREGFTPFDYNSIMLYGSYAFSTNRRPTITKKDGSLLSGRKNSLSALDIQGVAKIYGGKTTNPDPDPNPDPDTNPEPSKYKNGKWYVIYNVRVYRHNNQWWYLQYGKNWRRVYSRNNQWYYY